MNFWKIRDFFISWFSIIYTGYLSNLCRKNLKSAICASLDVQVFFTCFSKHGILQGIEGLETGLKKLGYNGNSMLVASSFGGFCATLYAARNPKRVKSAVLIDANHVCWFTDTYVDSEMKERIRDSATIKKQHLAMYYQSLNLKNTVELMKRMPFPATIPVIDLVSEKNFPDSVMAARWKQCHKQFADAQPNREGITAYGCGHVIFNDNPSLVINAIVKAYGGRLGKRSPGLRRGNKNTHEHLK